MLNKRWDKNIKGSGTPVKVTMSITTLFHKVTLIFGLHDAVLVTVLGTFNLRILSSFMVIQQKDDCRLHKARPFLFVGLRYPPIWKIEICKKKNGSETNWR